MRLALSTHWPEYLMEAAGLGIFMISAGLFSTILEHPDSAIHLAIPDPFVRRILMGLAMGLTATGIIYSPWGKQSGAHLNPAVTVTFLRLGKVKRWDAVFYCLAQFVGGLGGTIFIGILLAKAIAHPSIRYAVTAPGTDGIFIAFIAEMTISFILMSVVLRISSNDRLARYTGLFAGTLVATYIAFEAPLSGMSMNPARTFASAVPAHVWTAFWIYFTAPIIGMLFAGEIFQMRSRVKCAKLHHDNNRRCIFCNKTSLAIP